jgi:acetate kinase
MQRFPNIGHFACFDTVFHQTMPEEANTYPLPPEFRSSGVRRYGFHGLSCESVVRQLRALDDIPRRMVIAHLGSGCSVTALLDGQSVDTTMGLTPTGGIVMGTRSGDLDPGLVIYLMRQQQGSRDEAASAVEKLLNKRSGIASLSMMPNDVKAVRKAANGGNADATLALKVFTRSIAKTIGAFCWLLGGLDAIVFTGGIGEHDPQTPAEVLAGLAELGIELDATAAGQAGDGIRQISSSRSKIDVRIVPAQEDRMISIHVRKMAASETKQQQSKGKP